MARPSKAQGRITRGTTGVNRLRRMDRWIAAHPALREAADPLVVDLGYGASHRTPSELLDRLRRVRDDVRVVGIEIDPARVEAARPFAREGLSFEQGGFEVPVDARPAVIRAANVLRQYDEAEVAAAWATMLARLQPGGMLLEGTCNEVGRVASWVGLRAAAPAGAGRPAVAAGPETFTIALHLDSLGGPESPEGPSVVAERLPKALIHRNVPGERIHALLRELDAQWAMNAPLATFSARQRWIAAVQGLRATGWPVRDGVSRWRLGELTLPWEAVAPRA
ncbi:class I SAM-dependent methyltransferase [Microcella daejeonensis]|uniref:Class I SAM-dependent methyltransferase n=1 Tax=Microcella daejeonensis TaxID=2994971 RepID=A0A9E8MM39_9MICO|nr:class I SAM-dependent methyltransferase [Microcella daejeonensis]WAB81959.1 class I SAM-dependent methyltransferase [Microcella daejeonensis]